MGRTRRRIAALTLSTLLTAIAAVDASRERTWDVVVILSAALVLQLALLAAGTHTRREVGLRSDLYGWAAQRSADTGEDLDHFADRCLAAYRAGLTSSDPEEESPALPGARGHGRHAAALSQPAARSTRTRP